MFETYNLEQDMFGTYNLEQESLLYFMYFFVICSLNRLLVFQFGLF